MASQNEWKTIKIPVEAYEQAVALRDGLVRSGLDALPPRLREIVLEQEDRRGIGIGTIVTLGLASLEDTVEKRRR